MKTATIPAVRVEPEFREEVERLLTDGESLSEFVEAAVRASVRIRAQQSEFVARGLRSLASAKSSGEYLDASTVTARLERKLEAARAAAKVSGRKSGAAPVHRNLRSR
jgi:hypothetical protein